MQIYMLNWRLIVIKSELPANAKYLALYLSTWMNEWGDNCYPSIKRISHETGLSKQTVIKYIQVLRADGWLEAKKKGFDGQAWSHNQYYPNIPDKAVKELDHLNEGGQSGIPRRSISDNKAVKEVDTIFTDNSTDNSTDTTMLTPKKAVNVPYQQIVNLYHEKLPNNPQIAKLNESRKRQIKARWNNGIGDIDAWERYFDLVSDSKFLTGQCPPSRDRSKPFIADIDFLIKEANVLKIVEGKYHE